MNCQHAPSEAKSKTMSDEQSTADIFVPGALEPRRNVIFTPGATVRWTSKGFRASYWNSLTEEQRAKYYGELGYGIDTPKLFTFLCHHRPQVGHCVIVSMDDQKVHTMVHTDELELVPDDEC